MTDLVTYNYKIEQYKCIKQVLNTKEKIQKYVGHLAFLRHTKNYPVSNNQVFKDDDDKNKYITYINSIYKSVLNTKYYLDNKIQIDQKVQILIDQFIQRKVYFDQALELFIKILDSKVFPDNFINVINPELWVKYHILYRFLLENWRDCDYNYINYYTHYVESIKVLSLKYSQFEDIENDKSNIKPFLKFEVFWTDELYHYFTYMSQSYSYDFCEKCKLHHEIYGIFL
tara:strand:- start:1087 stop:1770 length:684 start_codon:yes stop_codon:yes gene_type:complete